MATSSIASLRPDSRNVSLQVKVLDSKVVRNRPKGASGPALKVSECLLADESGVIVFTARNEHADLAQPGTYLTLTNVQIDMFRGSMRLAMNSKSSLEAAPQLNFKARVDNNMSLIEFELMLLTETGAPVGEAADGVEL